jgi:hypothetical protein
MILMREIEKYCENKQMSFSTFGRLVARDPRLVWDMRNGRSIGAKLLERIIAHLKGDSL